MVTELNPEDVRGARFRVVFRGVDRAEVESFLVDVAAKLSELETERDRLASQLAASAPRDMEAELDSVGREVGGILQSAWQAADAMRERAGLDATKWRDESTVEAEKSRREAAVDAEAMRRDAWAVGTELLEQASVESRKMREQAERDVLTVMGEAEREAHRLTSGARREAEDVVRAASMEADKMTNEASQRRDDIIEAANRAAGQAQERARALEHRRDELLEELETVRSTLTRLEGSLEERRGSLDLSTESSTVKVVPSRPSAVEGERGARTWEPGETVRVVPRERRSPVVSEPSLPALEAEEPILEVDPAAASKAEPPERARSPSAESPSAKSPSAKSPSVAPGRPAEGAAVGADDAVEALFASLRGASPDDEQPAGESPLEPKPESEPEPAAPAPRDSADERDRRLLPITNRALRGAQKSITELQNIALDSLRTDESWRPKPQAVAEALRAELTAVWAESFAAGHGAAEEIWGSKLQRPPTPKSSAPGEFGEALGEAAAAALDEAGEGQKERQAAASKVYRVWRSDEAERRIRELAVAAYERAVKESAPPSV